MLNFVTHFFHDGYKYSATVGYRSAIRGVEHPRVLTLLSGIFNNRSTQLTFNFAWDLKNLLDFWEAINSEALNLKELTLKLTMLLALVSAVRASEISFLDIQYLVKHLTGYIFQFGKITKPS